ncbi:MAG: HhH-GPD-type base excision DNA repair protein [Mycobacteriales bacterium]
MATKTKTHQQAAPRIVLAADPDADDLLATDPLALLIGMLLDQQVPMEKAFVGPHVLRERIGHDLDAAEIAAYDPDRLAAIFAGPPAIHRFPQAMAKRTQALCRLVVDNYGGEAAAVWADGDGPAVLERLKKLPGFGQQKARIFLALLGKQYGVAPAGWQEAAGDFGGTGVFYSVADIVDDASLAKVRAHKKEMKAAAKAARG